MKIIQGVKGNKATLFQGDSVELMAQLPHWDAWVGDPPYNISYVPGSKQRARFTKKDALLSDQGQFTPQPWLEVLGKRPMIMWGANNFVWLMPHTKAGWIVWDKRCSASADRILGASFELAWCSNTNLFAFARIQHGGAINADGTGPSGRVHPTQKPISLMLRCFELLRLEKPCTILDPYMGSGTTGVAAMQAGFDFIGVELDPKWYPIAERRITEASRQLRLV